MRSISRECEGDSPHRYKYRMNSDQFRSALIEETERLDAELSGGELDTLCLHYELLRKWNPRVRLVGTIEPARAAVELFADSVLACRFAGGLAGAHASARVIDIGSGAGFPGVVAKILRPLWPLTLVENNAKKVSFLKTLGHELALADAIVLRERAERLAHMQGGRRSSGRVRTGDTVP